jgi:hypothetical protein
MGRDKHLVATRVSMRDIPRAEWNLFVSLNGDNDLERFAKRNLNQMEEVGSIPGKLNIFALADGFDRGGVTPGRDGDGWDSRTRLLWIQKDPNKSSKIASRELEIDPSSELGKLLAAGNGELDMGDPQVINAALTYVQAQAPSSKLMVDIWDHGKAWKGVSSDHTSGTKMHPAEGDLGVALRGVRADVLGFDACEMGALEIADLAQQAGAGVMVASEYLEPGDSWNYAEILGRVQGLFEANGDVTPQKLGSEIARSYAAGGITNTSLGVTDLSKLGDVNSKLNDFARSLIEVGGLSNRDVSSVYQRANRMDGIWDQMDLGDFAQRIADSTALPSEVRDAARALVASVEAACELHFGGTPGGFGFTSKGLSIFAPTRFEPSYTANPDVPWAGSAWTELIRGS